jgi:tight adherence protein C
MSLVTSIVAGAAVVLFVFGLPVLRRPRLPERVELYLSGLQGRPSNLLASQPAGGSSGRLWLEVRIERLLPGKDSLRERLAAAGYEREAAGFRVEQLTWSVTAVLALWAPLALRPASSVAIDARALLLLSLIAFCSGWLTRDWWLTKQIEERRAALQEELPAAIDLITLSIMSGESVPASFARVAGIIPSGIGRELQGVVADVRAGDSIVVALEALKERLPIPVIGRFVDALITGIERGAPLSDVLRAQAEDGRESRRRQLLEIGGRREVVMLVPIVFLLMPTVVAFALYPGLVALDLLVP